MEVDIISYPEVGKPPKCPEGFIRVPGEPFKFKLNLLPCTERKLFPYKSPCGKRKINIFCEMDQCQVNHIICSDCTKRKDPSP